NVFLYVYCWDHAVAQCAGCAQSFRQEEFGADPFDCRTYGCRHCGADLTESIRAHLVACAMLPAIAAESEGGSRGHTEIDQAELPTLGPHRCTDARGRGRLRRA